MQLAQTSERDSMKRRMNFQSIAWFWDLYQRNLIDLDPPYQRRSVWNQEFKDYFIDTILQGFPAPSIFLFQKISPTGVQNYSVVDGKQRLTTLFAFASNEFPVGDKAVIGRVRGRYFKDLPDTMKSEFWQYLFAVEYVPSEDEDLINNIFDRINRNVAKLSRQELRHAKFAGEFIVTAETLSTQMLSELPANFPRLTSQAKRQMKDVEMVAQLLLLLEEGPKSYSQDDVDLAFSDRDTDWERKEEVSERFRVTVETVKRILDSGNEGQSLKTSRLVNQADFYSLFGALDSIVQEGQAIDYGLFARRLRAFVDVVEDTQRRIRSKDAGDYYEAARSASNDIGARSIRLEIISRVLLGHAVS